MIVAEQIGVNRGQGVEGESGGRPARVTLAFPGAFQPNAVVPGLVPGIHAEPLMKKPKNSDLNGAGFAVGVPRAVGEMGLPTIRVA
jgi:hypothetical protein